MKQTDLRPEISADLINEAISWRRHLHKCPEVAFEEHQTAEFVASELSRFGLRVHRGIARTGVVGTLSCGGSQRAIGIRADMDALPIQEATGAPHASSNSGAMHACGHDGHVAMLLGAARACTQLTNLDGTVHFIFQPAEEGAGGAKRMLEDGLFQRFPCDTIYSLHNWPALPLGTCVVRDGPVLAAFGVFEILVSSSGCHGAFPHEGRDCIVAGCQLVSALQSIVSRNIDPRMAAVVSVTQFLAGDTVNVLPPLCTIRGTTRWFDDHVGEILERRIAEICNAIAAGFGCDVQIKYERRCPATVNNIAAAETLREVAKSPFLSLRLIDLPPSTGSEDFAFMMEAVPGCYMLLGTGGSSESRLHSPVYDFNDDALPFGVRLWVSLVQKVLATA